MIENKPDIQKLSLKDLFHLQEDIFAELRKRGIIHSSNNVISNYAEKLACLALKLSAMPESTKGHDATDDNGKKYEVKGRKLTQNNSRQLSALRDLDQICFDYLVVILFQNNFDVLKAAKIPHQFVLQKSVFNKHQ